jgi:hypothetical protein
VITRREFGGLIPLQERQNKHAAIWLNRAGGRCNKLDLVIRDDKGDIYTVRYDAVNAMLPNEFLHGHRKNEEQEATIARQQKQIDALTAGLQKVSAQLEVRKPATTVLNDQ